MSKFHPFSRLTAVCSVFFAFFLSLGLSAQDQTATRITFENPSMEDKPSAGRQPRGWANCGFPDETPPDTHSGETHFFCLNAKPQDGETFVGMVTRDNNTHERVGNKLSKPLNKGKIYTFSVWLCRSLSYKSKSRETNFDAHYTTPAVLKIWLGNSYGDLKDHLTTTEPIENSDWVKYTFVFSPTITADHICFEAFYANSEGIATNGNILIDNVSEIEEIQSEETALAPEHEVKPLEGLPISEKSVTLWPNPVNENLMVALKAAEVNDAWMEIFDMQGKLMARYLVKRGVINKYKIGDWASGTYKYSIKSRSGDFVESGLIEVLKD
jgi:Secretion system C-terminal sorting domain